VEWDKRELPHTYILIWLTVKIIPNEIDKVISAEILDLTIANELFKVVIKNMIHGPCGIINTNSQCMIDGKCYKRYPREFLKDTITGNDSYLLYQRRITEDYEKTISFKVKEKGNIVEVDNR